MQIQSDFQDPAGVTFLIDGSIHIFRAWFGIPDHFFDESGRPMNAVYGYAAFLMRFLQQVKPRKVVVAFDESLFRGFRHRLYPDYKANRALPDDALAFQLVTCRRLTEWLGIGTVASEVYEADDLIAAIARKRRQRGESVVVLSTDKDLAQVITEGDYLWDFHGGRLLDHRALADHWGFAVSRIAAFLAVAGDAADNIPGVPGVGTKTATRLFSHFCDLDGLYDNIDDISTLGLRGGRQLKERLLTHEESARLFHELTRLRDTAKCSWGDKTVKLKAPDKVTLQAWWQQSGLTRALRLDQFLADYEPTN